MAHHTILITGANSGFGLSLVLLALKQGHKVIGTARNVSKAQTTSPEVERLGGKWLELDVTSEQTQEIISKTVREQNVDVIINNAGYAIMGPVEDISIDQLKQQFDTNVYGPVRVMKGAIPIFRERKAGTIVNISSVAGLSPLPAGGAYSGSKYALEGGYK
jgi:NADP-dependent 3-hydroxy acid dehydrogenase YdfG